MCGVETVSLNDSIVGKIILENITHNGNTIIFRGQTINPKHVMELRKIGYLPIKVQSKQLGEICFVNKKINLWPSRISGGQILVVGVGTGLELGWNWGTVLEFLGRFYFEKL